jgi:hypothetical protein
VLFEFGNSWYAYFTFLSIVAENISFYRASTLCSPSDRTATC